MDKLTKHGHYMFLVANPVGAIKVDWCSIYIAW